MRENTDQIDSEYGHSLRSDRINDSTPLQKNKGQRKPVFWHILHSVNLKNQDFIRST